jgi:hypothetical protein
MVETGIVETGIKVRASGNQAGAAAREGRWI